MDFFSFFQEVTVLTYQINSINMYFPLYKYMQVYKLILYV